jgi:hypothetical protein
MLMLKRSSEVIIQHVARHMLRINHMKTTNVQMRKEK